MGDRKIVCLRVGEVEQIAATVFDPQNSIFQSIFVFISHSFVTMVNVMDPSAETTAVVDGAITLRSPTPHGPMLEANE